MNGRAEAAGWVTSQGSYAGSVSRLAAWVVDAVVSTGLFTLGLAAASLLAQVVTGHAVTWDRGNIVVVIIYAIWEFFYFGYSWAAGGRTFGMAVLGIRVVRADGATLDPWRGAVRAFAFPLSFLFFGLGFLGILVQREHRALHDLIAGSAVIYAWDARAARLRFLAREAELSAGGKSPPPSPDVEPLAGVIAPPPSADGKPAHHELTDDTAVAVADVSTGPDPQTSDDARPSAAGDPASPPEIESSVTSAGP